MNNHIGHRLVRTVIGRHLIQIGLGKVTCFVGAIGLLASAENFRPVCQALKIIRIGGFCCHGAIIAATQKSVKGEMIHAQKGSLDWGVFARPVTRMVAVANHS